MIRRPCQLGPVPIGVEKQTISRNLDDHLLAGRAAHAEAWWLPVCNRPYRFEFQR